MNAIGVKAIDYSTGKSYSYGDQTGTWQSIKSDGGQINSNGNPNESVQSASVGGTTVTSAVTTGVISVAPITATTTKAGQLSTATGSLVRSSHTLPPPFPYSNITQATATGTGGIVAPSSVSNSTGSGSGSGSGSGGSGANSTLATTAKGSGAGPTPTASGIATQSSAMAADFRLAGAASFSLLATIVAALAL